MRHVRGSVRLPASLLIDITNEALTQVLPGMGQHDSRPPCGCLKTWCDPEVENPSLPFKAPLDVAAVGEHCALRKFNPRFARRATRGNACRAAQSSRSC